MTNRPTVASRGEVAATNSPPTYYLCPPNALEVSEVSDGIHVFSNSTLNDESWPKVSSSLNGGVLICSNAVSQVAWLRKQTTEAIKNLPSWNETISEVEAERIFLSSLLRRTASMMYVPRSHRLPVIACHGILRLAGDPLSYSETGEGSPSLPVIERVFRSHVFVPSATTSPLTFPPLRKIPVIGTLLDRIASVAASFALWRPRAREFATRCISMIAVVRDHVYFCYLNTDGGRESVSAAARDGSFHMQTLEDGVPGQVKQVNEGKVQLEPFCLQQDELNMSCQAWLKESGWCFVGMFQH